MKDIEKYIGLYLLVYVAILAVCGFFQYMAVCQGQSLACAFDMKGVNTIITTTAYVLTPIIAIVGFINWKDQIKYSKKVDYILEIRKKLREIKELMFELRSVYCLSDTDSTDSLDSRSHEYLSKLNKFDEKLVDIKNSFLDLGFILRTNSKDKLIIHNQITLLKGFSIQSRRAHYAIYRAIKANKPLKMTEKLARDIAAYDDLEDYQMIKTSTGIIEINQSKIFFDSFKKLEDICLETYEEGASKNVTLLDKFLDR